MGFYCILVFNNTSININFIILTYYLFILLTIIYFTYYYLFTISTSVLYLSDFIKKSYLIFNLFKVNRFKYK